MNSLSSICSVSVMSMKRSARYLAVMAALLACFSFQALAQQSSTATIVGTVTDPSGSVVPNADITVTDNSTGQVRSLKTTENGEYNVPALLIGRYSVKAEAPGFKVSERTGVVLNVGDRSRIDFTMQVGSTQENVTVEADAIKVQTDSGEVSNVITGQQITQLATNGRSLYTLYALTPGASSLQGDFITPTAVSGDNGVSVNGQRSAHNLQVLDGGENLDRGGAGGASIMPSIDAIAEFRNLTSNYSAEFGLSSAATITAVVKSGTKQFHAEAWEFLRNDALDARNYFNPEFNPNGTKNKVAELRFNTYGFNLGGQVPLWKSHPTFFFYNMEWRSLVQGGLTNQTVPLTSTYGGNFGSTLITVPTAAQLSPAQKARFTADGLTLGSPFPSNTIPTNLLDPNAQALLGAGIFPGPTSGAQFIGGNNSPTTVREEIARIDHQFSDKFSVFGHWVADSVSQTYGTTQWSGDNVPTVGDVFANPGYSGIFHTTYVISPTLLNEASFNYNGNRIHILPDGVFTAPSGFAFNRLFTGPNADTRIPSIQLNGSTGTDYTSNWTPWNNKADDYQIRDDVSWTKGSHQLKMGGSWAIYKKQQDAFANTEGNFNFNGQYTGNDFADFLLGYAQGYNEDAVKITGQWNNISLAAYLQDNWRVNSRLTLNLGLRWDGVPHTYEANGQSSNFYPNLYNPADAATFDSNGNICSANSNPPCAGGASPGLSTSPNPILAGVQFYTNGIGVGGKNGIPKGLANSAWHDFGPRLGFAYDLTGQGKTVVRGGFGTMYERIQGNDMYNGATNPPGDLQPHLNNVLLSNPGVNVGTGATITAAALPVLPAAVTGIATYYPSPVNYQYSVGVQQALSAASVLSVSYVGSQSRHENYYQEVNLPPASALATLQANGGAGINQLYNYSGFGPIRLAENGASGHYNSLQVDLHANLRSDLQAEVGYTLSRSLDAVPPGSSGGDLGNILNPYEGWRYNLGPSIFDRTNVLFVNFVYDIPIFKNSSSRLLKSTVGGWELSGIITAESGAPLNMGVNGPNVSNVVPNSGNLPDWDGHVNYSKTVNEWFNPADFTVPAPGTYGNMPVNVVRGPGRDDWNLALFKEFMFSESRGSHLEFRVETFNTWNHTQFKGDYNNGGISTNVGSSNFGAITSAFDPREFQLGLKLIF